jgi:hypothetical protein
LKSKHDLKKLSMLAIAEGEWKDLGLSPAQLQSLGSYLDAVLGSGPFHNDLRWTESWLNSNAAEKRDHVVNALLAKGNSSDLKVLHNVVRGG